MPPTLPPGQISAPAVIAVSLNVAVPRIHNRTARKRSYMMIRNKNLVLPYSVGPASAALKIAPRLRNSSRREGLRMYWLAPNRTASVRSRSASEELRITTGICRHLSLRRIYSKTARPGFFGRFRSIIARSGHAAASASIAWINAIAFSPSAMIMSSPSTHVSRVPCGPARHWRDYPLQEELKRGFGWAPAR